MARARARCTCTSFRRVVSRIRILHMLIFYTAHNIVSLLSYNSYEFSVLSRTPALRNSHSTFQPGHCCSLIDTAGRGVGYARARDNNGRGYRPAPARIDTSMSLRRYVAVRTLGAA
jgi:hypothetical protein